MPLSTPPVVVEPFAVNGLRNTVPVGSLIPTIPGRASYNDGFPPLTMTPLESGGVPPFGRDMNGVLYDLSAHIAWQQGGGSYTYDSGFSSNNTGYALGAVLRSASNSRAYFRNDQSGNTNDPDSNPTNWSRVDLPDTFPTAQEIAEGVSVVLTNYPPGDGRRYGAVGDGVTDDTAALQDWAKLSGVLTLPPGEYRVTDTIELQQNNTTIIAYGAEIRHDTADISDVLYATELSHIAIYGLAVDGMKAEKPPSPTVQEARGIHLDRCEFVTVQNCYVHDTIEHGIRIGLTVAAGTGESLYVKVLNNTVKDCGNITAERGWGIWLFGEVRGVTVANNLCIDNIGGGIFLDDCSGDATPNLDSLRFCFTGNVCQYAGPESSESNGFQAGIGADGSRHGAITGNVVFGYRRGIAVDSGQARTQTGYLTVTGNSVRVRRHAMQLRNAQYAVITGNVFEGTDAAANSDVAVSIEGDDATLPLSHNKHIKFANNLVLAAKRAVDIEGITGATNTSEEVAITGNHIVYVGSGATINDSGVFCGDATGPITIERNDISGGFYDGIRISEMNMGFIRGNKIRQCTNRAIRVGSAENYILGNFCSNNPIDIDLEASSNAAGTVIKDNELYGTIAVNGASGNVTATNNIGFRQQLWPPQFVSAANIAAIGNAINTTGKFAGKQVWDMTNNRMMVADGASAAAVWYICDGSGSVTPS